MNARTTLPYTHSLFLVSRLHTTTSITCFNCLPCAYFHCLAYAYFHRFVHSIPSLNHPPRIYSFFSFYLLPQEINIGIEGSTMRNHPIMVGLSCFLHFVSFEMPTLNEGKTGAIDSIVISSHISKSQAKPQHYPFSLVLGILLST